MMLKQGQTKKEKTRLVLALLDAATAIEGRGLDKEGLAELTAQYGAKVGVTKDDVLEVLGMRLEEVYL